MLARRKNGRKSRRTITKRKKVRTVIKKASFGLITITRGNLHYTIAPDGVSIYNTRTKELKFRKLPEKYYKFFVNSIKMYQKTKKKHYLNDTIRDIKLLIEQKR